MQLSRGGAPDIPKVCTARAPRTQHGKSALLASEQLQEMAYIDGVRAMLCWKGGLRGRRAPRGSKSPPLCHAMPRPFALHQRRMQ